jgi:phosphoglycolate phosphatase
MSLLRRFDAAIVDLDGTMIDTAGDFDHALSAAFADLGLPAPGLDFIRRTIGKGSEHLIARALAHVGADASMAEAAWRRYQHHYLAVNGQHANVYEGVVEGLQRLRSQGLRLACLTNKPSAFARPLLDAKALSQFFEHVFGGDAFERKKPDPLPIHKTCEIMSVPAARMLVIGDSSNDAVAARAAGCTVVLVSYGYNHGEPVSSAGADAVIDRLDQLEAGLALLRDAR